MITQAYFVGNQDYAPTSCSVSNAFGRPLCRFLTGSDEVLSIANAGHSVSVLHWAYMLGSKKRLPDSHLRYDITTKRYFQMEGESSLHYSAYMLTTLFFTILVQHIAVGQTTLLRLLGDTAELTCTSSTQDDTYIWADLDVSPAQNIYLVNDINDQEKSESAKNEPKYNNFGIANNYPGSVNLIIQSVDIEDEGQYQCTLFNVAADNVAYDVHVEALPTSVSVSCTTHRPDECSEPAGVSFVFTCTCTAVGAYPDDLQFEWTNAVSDPTSTSIDPSTNRSGAFNYTGIATFVPTDTENTVTCSLGGYSGSWSVPDSEYTVGPPGKCDISISCNDEATVATLTCSCPNGVPEEIIYTYYDENGAVVTSDVSVTPGVQFTVSCRGCNGVNYGEDTFITKTETCTVSSFTSPTSMFTNDDKLANPPKSNTGLIVACSIEAAIILVLTMVIIFLIRRIHLGYHKENSQSYTEQVRGDYGTDNKAYMDLQELGYEKNGDMVTLQIPEQNVKMTSIIPGQGMLQYRKALITRIKGNQDGVVKTLSDDSTVTVIKLLRSEVQHNIKLGNGNNIVKLLGWCDTVPTYVIFEHVYGETLSNHLKEEFSRHKVHTYGNTEKKKFQVLEKGSVDILSKYALHAARGIQFLHRNKFLHPGLRAKKILVDSTGNCKLYDFVSLKNASDWIRFFWIKSVPYQWMSPEFLFLENISSAGDIWSFGVLLWELFSYGCEPYISQTRSDVEKQIRQKELLQLPENCPGAIWQLMITCWEQSVEKRSKIDEITSKLASLCNTDKEYQEIQ